MGVLHCNLPKDREHGANHTNNRMDYRFLSQEIWTMTPQNGRDETDTVLRMPAGL